MRRRNIKFDDLIIYFLLFLASLSLASIVLVIYAIR